GRCARTLAEVTDDASLAGGELPAEGLLLPGDSTEHGLVRYSGPGAVAEGLDGAGDGGFGLEDLASRVGLLPGPAHADERHQGASSEDAVHDSVEVRRRPPVETGRGLG